MVRDPISVQPDKFLPNLQISGSTFSPLGSTNSPVDLFYWAFLIFSTSDPEFLSLRPIELETQEILRNMCPRQFFLLLFLSSSNGTGLHFAIPLVIGYNNSAWCNRTIY